MTSLARVHFQPQSHHLVYSSSGPLLISIALFLSASFTASQFASPLDLQNNPLTCEEISRLIFDFQTSHPMSAPHQHTNGDLMEGATLNKEVDNPEPLSTHHRSVEPLSTHALFHKQWVDFADKDHATLKANGVSKQVNYWLYGTATEINWFDKACLIGWDYVKGCLCNITSSYVGSPESAAKLVEDNPAEGLIGPTGEASCSVKQALPYYIAMALGCLVLGYAVAENLDVFMTGITYIDVYIYEFLCMFDFPGFMVDKRATMPLLPGINLDVMHSWKFIVDPADGILRLSHLASYTLHHEYLWFDLNLLLLRTPCWSIPSYATLGVAPGLYWPLNYDHVHHMELFRLR